jgi:cell wall-associated NlpC family hydrolase
MIGVCNLSVIPMRAEPSDKAELVNQILFGECFKLLDIQEKWTKVELIHDAYVGWIDNKQYHQLENSNIEAKQIVKQKFVIKDNLIFPLGSIVDFELKSQKTSILKTAKLFLNTPYLWGGRTFMGIDCSGFVQVVFRVNGISLLRDAYQQADAGNKFDFYSCKTNDLAFFVNKDNKIIHVGIVIKTKNQTKIIHASGKVRIDILDEKGIFNEETQQYTHYLYCIKRIV